MKVKINTEINGQNFTREVSPRMLASDFIRDELDLTGTHVGCEHGVCGSCTIAIDGLTARACLKFAVQLNDKKVETIESFQNDPNKKDILDIFKKHHALQCGFCTAGFVLTINELKNQNFCPSSDKEIREILSGNLCRCTGYENIIKASKEIFNS